jgi:hypothetical protein
MVGYETVLIRYRGLRAKDPCCHIRVWIETPRMMTAAVTANFSHRIHLTSYEDRIDLAKTLRGPQANAAVWTEKRVFVRNGVPHWIIFGHERHDLHTLTTPTKEPSPSSNGHTNICPKRVSP